MNTNDVAVKIGINQDVAQLIFAFVLKLLAKANSSLRALLKQLEKEISTEIRARNIRLDAATIASLSAALVWIVLTSAILPGKKITAGIIAAKLGARYSKDTIEAASNIILRLQKNNSSMEILADIAKHPLVRPFLNKKTTRAIEKLGKLPILRCLKG
jgi:ABC-type bacteriocin/lantibiotic exporter with double-glycine peptidase domain